MYPMKWGVIVEHPDPAYTLRISSKHEIAHCDVLEAYCSGSRDRSGESYERFSARHAPSIYAICNWDRQRMKL
jgi:hypothetical protein